MDEMMPDISDLNDYILEHHPAVFRATKYRSVSNQYDCWFEIWVNDGRPTKDFESALWLVRDGKYIQE